MSKTKDVFIRMREQELYDKQPSTYDEVMQIEGWDMSGKKHNVYDTDIMFKELICMCINDAEYETTINVCNSDGDFDTDENNVVENVNIEVCCSSLDSIISRIYSFSVSEIVKVCKENGMRFPNEPTLYDIRDCSKEIVELLLSR